MTIDIISQHSNTLPSGFKITFTVGRVVKDKPHSLPLPTQAADTAGATTLLPSAPAAQLHGAAQ